MPELNPQRTDWKGQYEAIMAQLGLQDQGLEANRASFRFKFNVPDQIVLVHIGSLVGILNDISAVGMSVNMSIPLSLDRRINLSIDQKFRGKVRIVNNRLLDSESTTTRGVYRSGARFLNEEDGYRCMVSTLRLSSQIPRF